MSNNIRPLHARGERDPFQPLCKDALAYHVQELIETGSRSVGGWK